MLYLTSLVTKLVDPFNNDYAYVLGHICYQILTAGLNGYMATMTNLKSPVNKWKCGAAPITALMTVKHWSQNAGSTSTSIGRPVIHPPKRFIQTQIDFNYSCMLFTR